MKANGFFISTGPRLDQRRRSAAECAGAGAPFSYQDDSSDTLWAGKVQLDWRPQDGTLVYGASAAA
jgi:outer membrane receptor protein involved in Fe transport